MTREEFDSFIAQQELEVESASIKKVFKKFFMRKEVNEKMRKKTASADDIEEHVIDDNLPEMEDTIFINLNRDEMLDLNKIKNEIKKI
jgi:hypothetical protein